MTRAGWATMVTHKVVQARKVMKGDLSLAEALLIESEAILARFPDMNVLTKRGRSIGHAKSRVDRLKKALQRAKARVDIPITSSSSELRLAWARTGIHSSIVAWHCSLPTPTAPGECLIRGVIVPESIVFEVQSFASTQIGCWCGVAYELKKIAANRGVANDDLDVLFSKLAVHSFEDGPINSKSTTHPTLTRVIQ